MSVRATALTVAIGLFSLVNLSAAQEPDVRKNGTEARSRGQTQLRDVQGTPYDSTWQTPMDPNLEAMYRVFLEAGRTYSRHEFAYVYMTTYGFNPGVIAWYARILYTPYGYGGYPYCDPYYSGNPHHE